MASAAVFRIRHSCIRTSGYIKNAITISTSSPSYLPIASSFFQTPNTSYFTPTLISLLNKRFLSSSPTRMSQDSTKAFFDVVKTRRTYYQLNNKAPIPDSEIIELARETVLHVPSSFNSQSARLVVLLKKDHERFWDLVAAALKPLVPADQFPKTEQKLNGFKAGYGTVR
jgi:hypothetical protein